MTRKIILWVGIIFMSAMTLIGVVIIGVSKTVQPENGTVEVNVENGKTTTIEFEDLCLLPGEQSEYTVKLNRRSDKAYQLTLKFNQGEESGLAEYAYVRIERYGKVIYDELLKNAFAQEPMVLDIDLSQETQDLTVVYYLPLEVGNEAQKAVAEFSLQITASNE